MEATIAKMFAPFKSTKQATSSKAALLSKLKSAVSAVSAAKETPTQNRRLSMVDAVIEAAREGQFLFL